jgi:hypothetical protein
MPFPPDSVEDFNDADILYSKNDFLPEQAYEIRASGVDDDDDDSYWNSYDKATPHTIFLPLKYLKI